MKTKVISNQFIQFLTENLTVETYFTLYKELCISKRMLTVLLRNPKRLTFQQLSKISELTSRPIDDFKKFIN